jgi:hypothetical protein
LCTSVTKKVVRCLCGFRAPLQIHQQNPESLIAGVLSELRRFWRDLITSNVGIISILFHLDTFSFAFDDAIQFGTIHSLRYLKARDHLDNKSIDIDNEITSLNCETTEFTWNS